MSRVRDAVIWNTSTFALHNDHWIQISINGHTFSQFIDCTQLILIILWIMKAESHIESRCRGWKFSVHLEPRTQFLLKVETWWNFGYLSIFGRWKDPAAIAEFLWFYLFYFWKCWELDSKRWPARPKCQICKFFFFNQPIGYLMILEYIIHLSHPLLYDINTSCARGLPSKQKCRYFPRLAEGKYRHFQKRGLPSFENVDIV